MGLNWHNILDALIAHFISNLWGMGKLETRRGNALSWGTF